MTKPELEMYSAVPATEFNTFWIPCTWFVNLLRDARQECRITDSSGLKLIMEVSDGNFSQTLTLFCCLLNNFKNNLFPSCSIPPSFFSPLIRSLMSTEASVVCYGATTGSAFL